MSDQPAIPVRVNLCRVCGKPGAIHSDKGVLRQRSYCTKHWSAYMLERKRERCEKDLLARLEADMPQGWRRVGTVESSPMPNGVTRLTVDHGRGTATLRRGYYLREQTLKHPDNWRALVRFYLHIGFKFKREVGKVLVLEKRAAAVEPTP